MRHDQALPAGTVTFLLTDVEGSSRLWEADPQPMSAAMKRRQEIIEDATTRHAGMLPVEQGEGDSSVSVFTRASDAVAAAVELQRSFAGAAWPGGVDLRVRMALHTAEAQPGEDGTYRGAAVNRCARLRSIAHGGQVLLSHATYEVLVDALGDAFVLRDLGSHRLRDLGRPERVWQLCHPELADPFPPLRSVDALANNLPVQLTSFIGRDAEISAVADLVREHRLVTLTGAGGSGKTRLALQVAAAIGNDFPDGIWWVDLAPLSDPSLVPAALAAVVRVRESPLEPMIDTVARYLAARRAVVVLDNCEHLVEPCAALAARLVQGCPAVTLVATSREPLRVQGETVWGVPPLSLPDNCSIAESEAVQLFVDRAQASQPTFALTDLNAPAVAQICKRLDGIPLAIELAAARTRVLTVEEIAGALADRFHLLTGGARTALPRQRTLESSVDWSHDLLDEAERSVFRRLAVFAGSFTLEAAQAVCAGDGIGTEVVLDVVSRLVDRSLVQAVHDAGTQTRYRMLETIRDYARHKLTDAGEAEAARDRHLDHYVTFAERARAGLEGPGLVGWLVLIDAELDNMRAALDWGPHSADPERGARLVGLLCLYWFARSELAIGRARLEATVKNASDGHDRASALSALCMVNYRAGDMAKAAACGDDAVAIARRLGNASLLGRALHWRAWVRFWGKADRFAAWADLEEAETLLRRADDRLFLSLNLALLAWSYIWTDEEPRARALLENGLTLAESAVSPHARCYCLLVLGFLDLVQGRFEEAGTHLGDALTLNREIGDHYAEVFGRAFLASTDMSRGRYGEAREGSERALETALEHRSPNGEVLLRSLLWRLDLVEGRIVDLRHAGALVEGLSEVFPQFVALMLASQAAVAVVLGNLSDAREHAAEALRVGREADVTAAMELALLTLARLSRLDGDAHTAEDHCHEALEISWRVHHRPAVCDVLETLAGAVAAQGRSEEAARILGAAHRLREDIGYARFPVYAPTYEADVESLRDALGLSAFDDAWAEGAALTIDDAVAYVRRRRGKRRRPAHGWNSLTPTELQVVELVAEGLTNPQIGDRLLISKRTVQSHMANVFAKVGVSTRAELAAAWVMRRSTKL